jgi:hypothetical protein
MRIGRAIVIPAILALGAAGSILAASAVPAAAAQASSAQVQSSSTSSTTNVFYHA